MTTPDEDAAHPPSPHAPIDRLLLATNNPHKVEELTQIFAALPHAPKLLTLNDADPDRTIPEPDETADTFLGNALIKAHAYAAATNLPCLADDSGLEVDALNGDPGVRSARYANHDGPRDQRDNANNTLLLNNLKHTPDERRTARFVCAMAVVTPAGQTIATARGTFEGRIAYAPKGTNGFGYDPLLILSDSADPLNGKHAAELTPQQKHARSHRGQAARAIAEQLIH